MARKPRFAFLIVAALPLLALLSGCEGVRKPRQEEKPKLTASASGKNELPVLGGDLLDGFEGPENSVWAFDAADDEGIAEYVTEGVTQGKKALRITLRDKGLRGKIQLRRDVSLDLSQASAVLVDITSSSDQFSAALGLKTSGDMYQESKAVQLRNGLNREVRFPLEGNNWKNAQSKWEFTGPPVNLQSVRRMVLLFLTNDESRGVIQVDNLRVEGAAFQEPGSASAAYREWRPEILLMNRPPEGASQFQTIEVQVAFRASYRDIFDSGNIALGMRVATPSGKNLDVRGFFGGLGQHEGVALRSVEGGALPPLFGPLGKPSDKKGKGKRKDKGEGAAKEAPKEAPKEAAKPAEKTEEEKQAAAAAQKSAEGGGEEEGAAPARRPTALVPIWLVRFTPQETGRYTLQMYVRNPVGETRTPEQSLVVVPEMPDPALPGRKGGNVRVSRHDARQLELQDDTPFYVFGENVCWTTDWAPYLKKIKAYGGNTCRVWLCPWGVNLERKQEPGTYDLREAARIDELMDLAEATGVRIIFCLTYHGANGADWAGSPYNQANGGPCTRPQEFFTDWRAKRQFKRLLSYAAARWGASPALLSWELMNEMDLARYDSPEEVVAWAREMAGHLGYVDVHGHLVTASVIGTHFQPELWQDPRLDFISIHGYGTDVTNVVYRHLSPLRTLSKPVLLAEFGGGTDPGDDIPDKDGARLQAALWLTACSPACGVALPWWWDTYIEARNLYPVLAAAGRFVAGEDRRGRFGEWVRKTYPDRGGVEANGVMDSQGARLYVHNPGWTRLPESRGAALLAAPLPLELSGMLDGAYRVEFWDAHEGKVFSTVEPAAKDGKLSIQLPAHAGEFGVKVDRKETLKPDLK
ncbi:MAG: cellulase family glycosylhydrolase [Planctomycetota bacterium]|nr:cellulase family glycosylhydrolase [Planctomycetota bacterium]